MILEKSIIGVNMATGHDKSYARVYWKNDGTYTKECIHAPIIDKITNDGYKCEVCVGYITSVDDKFVYGLVYNKYLTNELINNLQTSVSIEMG